MEHVAGLVVLAFDCFFPLRKDAKPMVVVRTYPWVFFFFA